MGVPAAGLGGRLVTLTAILVVSAHWGAAPLTIGSTDARTPLTYDFWGFPDRYYDAPGAPELAAAVEKSSYPVRK